MVTVMVTVEETATAAEMVKMTATITMPTPMPTMVR
jgi:hypothetical protein